MLLLAAALSVTHFATFFDPQRAIATDIRYFLYFAWRMAEGAVPHLDLFDNKTFLASFAGALFFRLGTWMGVEQLDVIRAGYLGICAAGGTLVFSIFGRLSRGSQVAGFLGLLAYLAFGLIGTLAAIGNVPKLIMAVSASAMGLLVHDRRWFLAGVAGAIAFMDWQIGALVWAAAFASALLDGARGRRAALAVACGGATGVAPFLLYYASHGALGVTFRQTIVGSIFRGTTSLAAGDGITRASRIAELAGRACPGQEWVFAMGVIGLAVVPLWLWKTRGSEEWRLLFALTCYHLGVMVFSLIDFQYYGDFFLLLHSVAFTLGLAWVGLYQAMQSLAAGAREGQDRSQRFIALAALAVAVAAARPAWLRPEIPVATRNVPATVTLADERAVAEEVLERTHNGQLVFFGSSELLFPMRYRNPVPLIYFNPPAYNMYARPGETMDVAAARVMLSTHPDAFLYSEKVKPTAELRAMFSRTRITSGDYGVVLFVKNEPGRRAAARGGAAGGPDIVLITVDTLRADEIGPYGAEPSSTPGVERLAAAGTVYEHAAAPMPLTRPSHFSILTSRYPREHGVMNNTVSLPASERTFPEILREAGYRTGGFVGVRLLSAEAGAAQGFEVFASPTDPRERRAEKVVRDAVAWLSGVRPEERFFLWVHLFDPHLPYDPPASTRLEGDHGLGKRHAEVSWADLEEIAARNGGGVSEEVLRYARSLYRGEIKYTDRWLGRLLDRVDATRDPDGTLVVFTADHGECFENGVYFEHANCLHEGAIRVPLIVRYPPAFAAGARVGGQVSLIDIAPTILRAAGLEIPRSFSGRPLQEIQEIEDASDRYVLVQYPFFQSGAVRARMRRHGIMRSVGGDPVEPPLSDSEMVGIVGSSWKYLRTTGKTTKEELYAMPDEKRDLSTSKEALRTQLAARLDALTAAHPLHVVNPGRIGDELRKTLESLGYLDASP